MRIFKLAAELQNYALEQKRAGRTIGLVPTMGFLHAGHASLIDIARKKADIVIVSIFVLFSGYGIIKDTISELLGQPADKELVSKISDIMLSRPEILGLHDLIIHSYGPGNLIGSAHAEVSAHDDLLQIHDTIDEVEKEIYERLHVMFTIHMDPIETDNQEIEEARKMMKRMQGLRGGKGGFPGMPKLPFM